MEPVSGIFSSPITSPQRNGDNTLSSDDMHMQESSAPDVTETLILRKTPKLPPARAATPKHTHIGSPKRMSAVRPVSRGKSLPPDAKETATSSPQEMSKTQPPANRVLDFAGDVVRRSIESLSPFKPRKAQRRSVGASRSDPFAPSKINGADVRPGETLPAKLSEEPEHLADVEEDADQDAEQDAEEDVEEEEVSAPPHTTIVEDLEVQQDLEEVLAPQPADNGPIMIDDDDAYQVIPDDAMPEEDEAQAAEEQETPIKRKRGRPRKSGDSVNSTQIQQTPQSLSTTKRKRGRPSLQSQRAEIDLTQSQVIEDGSDEAPVQKKQRGRPPKKRVIVLDDEEDQTIDPTILTHSNEDVAEDAAESSDHAQPKTKGKASAPAAPRERDANRAMRAASSPVKLNDPPSRLSKSPSKRAPSRGASMGPVSNVNLRATTPFEDAGERISRYGRPVLKPLQYWANETRVWKHGEVEGILRAEEVQKPKPAKKKGRKPGRKLGSGIARLDDIDEESDTESTVADEWEEEVGVIAGSVAKWNRSTQIGDPKELVREGINLAHYTLSMLHHADRHYRPRLCLVSDRDTRCRQLRVQVRKDHDIAILRLRRRRASARRLQARQEQPQNADVLLRARGQSHGRSRCARRAWRGEPVRHQQRRRLGCSER